MAFNDPSVNKVITKKDLTKMAWRSLFLQASFNYERMQAAGWLYSLLPGLKKIHKDEGDLSDAMQDHMEFFNTHPFLVTFIMGIIIAMEENKESRETIRGIKVATMGPLGGIGDALFWLTLLPISAGIGASMAMQGSAAGPIFFLVVFNVVHFLLRFGLMYSSYNQGVKAIPMLKENTQRISHAASIIGVSVVGALIASYIRLNLAVVITAGQATVNLQSDVIDMVMPKLLPLLYTLLMYRLVKKGWSPTKLIILTLGIGVIGHYIGLV